MSPKTFTSLEGEYNNFTLPIANVYVNGNKLTTKIRVSEIDVELTVKSDEVGMANITASCDSLNKSQPDTATLIAAFPLMAKIKIEMGYESKTPATIFEGFVFERRFEFEPQPAGKLTVSCADAKALMRMNNEYLVHKPASSYSAIVTGVLDRYKGQAASNVSATDNFSESRTFNQRRQTDFDFIVAIAKRVGYEFYVSDGKFQFKKRGETKLVKLSPELLNKAEYSNSLSETFPAVKLFAYDLDKKDEIESTASAPKKLGRGKTAFEILPETLSRKGQVHFTSMAQSDIKGYADAALQDNSYNLTTLALHTKGIPDLMPGNLIELDEMAAGIDGDYYITEARHKFSEKGYSSEIICASNTTVH